MADRPLTYDDLGLVPKLSSNPPPSSSPSQPTPPVAKITKQKRPIKINITRLSDIKPANTNLVTKSNHPAIVPPSTTGKALRTFTVFLSLPQEIRNLIYQFAFLSPKPIGSRQLRTLTPPEPYDSLWRQDRLSRRAIIATGLLLTSHQIYHESLPFLYRTPNTIIITSRKTLDRFAALPQPLPRCITSNCEIPTFKPAIWNGIFYPKEFDLAFLNTFEPIESISTYLPVLPGGIIFNHLILDISHPYPHLNPLFKSLTRPSDTPLITVIGTFTLRAWDFQRSLRLWIKSRDCSKLIEELGLHKVPILIQELPANMIGERTAWKVVWQSESIPRDGESKYGFNGGGLGEWMEKGQCKTRYKELVGYDIQDDMLDLQEIFVGQTVKRMRIE
jgi:hypothetical protein